MAVWGIGSFYRNSTPSDKTDTFLSNECAYIGWDEAEASALFRMFDSIKVGDIIYIKSFVPRSKRLHIKAVGIITNTKKVQLTALGTGIRVKWKEDFVPITIDVTPEIYRNNVFNNTLYEEFNTEIILQLIDALMTNR